MSFRWMFPETPYKLEPEFWDRLGALQKKIGGDLQVFDGYRSFERQDELREAVASRGENPDDFFVPPGQSSHNYGLGADVLGDLDSAHRYASSYGLFFPEANDPWHIEPAYVTQQGLPEPDEYVNAALAAIEATKADPASEAAQIAKLRLAAVAEGQAEEFNDRMFVPSQEAAQNKSEPQQLAEAQETMPDEGGASAAVAGVANQNQQAIQKLETAQSLNAMNAALAAKGPPLPGGQLIGGGGGGGGWQGIDAFLQANGVAVGPPTKGQTDGGSHASGSYHYQGTARDYGTAGSNPGAIYAMLETIAANPDGPIAELFYDPSGKGWKNGKNIGPIGGHSDHVHVALKPGRSLSEVGGGTQVVGGTPGRVSLEEAVITPGFQMAMMQDMMQRGAAKSYARSVPVYAAKQTDLVEQAQGGQVAGETEVLEPGAHETPAGQLAMAEAAMTGRQVVAQEKPPEIQFEEGTPGTVVGGGGAEGGGDFDSMIRQGMQQMGVDPSNFDAIKHRAMVESGGRNIIQSPSTRDVNTGGNEAFGPFQFVQGTFNRFAVPGYGDWKNPYHQVLAYINAVRTSKKYGGNFRHPSLMSRGGWSP